MWQIVGVGWLWFFCSFSPLLSKDFYKQLYILTAGYIVFYCFIDKKNNYCFETGYLLWNSNGKITLIWCWFSGHNFILTLDQSSHKQLQKWGMPFFLMEKFLKTFSSKGNGKNCFPCIALIIALPHLTLRHTAHNSLFVLFICNSEVHLEE